MMSCRSLDTFPAKARSASGSSPSSLAMALTVASPGGGNSLRSILLRYAGSIPARSATFLNEKSRSVRRSLSRLILICLPNVMCHIYYTSLPMGSLRHEIDATISSQS